MDHHEIEERITPYLLGDLPPEQAEQVREHLDTCDACRALSRELESTLDLLRGALAAEPAPERLDDARRERVFADGVPARETWWGGHRRGVVQLAAVAAMVLVLAALLLPGVRDAAPTSRLAAAPKEERVREGARRSMDKKAQADTFDVASHRADDVRVSLEQVREAPEAPAVPAPPAVTTAPALVPLAGDELGRGRSRANGPVDRLGEFAAGQTVLGTEVQPARQDAAKQAGRKSADAPTRGATLGGSMASSSESLFYYDGGLASRTQPTGERSAGESGSVVESGKPVLRRLAKAPAEATDADKADTSGAMITDGLSSGDALAEAEPVGFENVDANGAGADLSVLADEEVDFREKEVFAASGRMEEEGEAIDGISSLVKGMPEERPAWFRAYGVNPYRSAAEHRFSTFGIDVDTASYTLARNYLMGGRRPPAEAVRTEEVVNYFDYDTPAPVRKAFAIAVQGAPAPFGEGVLLKIGVKGKVIGRDDRRPSVLTFVVDTSGSMDTADRIGLVKASLRMLVGELEARDRVGLIQVDSAARLILEHTPVSNRPAILSAIDGLQCSGSTHLDSGIHLGYEQASRGFDVEAENRVLILSDGAANLGAADADAILDRVASFREQGIVCSVFGFGVGTYNDEMLETLANRGDGTYQFIDSEAEARRVFVDNLSAALNVIAKDVKIQVEFDPSRVEQYRQLGYENRQLAEEDFRNDEVDAGEVGSGQSVTALYEVILKAGAGGLGTVRVRYRDAASGQIEEIARPIRSEDVSGSLDEVGARFRLAAAAAEFAELLRGSPFAEDGSYDDVARVLRPVVTELDYDPRVAELYQLVRRAARASLAP